MSVCLSCRGIGTGECTCVNVKTHVSAPRPEPPEGYASWLDYVLDPGPSFGDFADELAHSRDELAELRKELSKLDASETKLITERDELSSLLQDVEITLGGDPNFATGEGALERSKEVAAELAKLRKDHHGLRAVADMAKALCLAFQARAAVKRSKDEQLLILAEDEMMGAYAALCAALDHAGVKL